MLCVGGTIVLTFEGSPGKELAPGSYAFIPADAKHIAACQAGSECTYFEEQQGPFDMTFVDKK